MWSLAEDDLAAPTTVTLDQGFETFYRREYRGLVALAYALVGNRQAAEDVAQEAMVATYRSWQRIAAMDNPAGYARRTTANLAASTFRRRWTEAKVLVRLAARPVQHGELDEAADEFWAAVRRLPRRQAQAVALRYVYSCPVSEVAQVMGISEGAAKSHLHAGRRRLAGLLGLDGRLRGHGPGKEAS